MEEDDPPPSLAETMPGPRTSGTAMGTAMDGPMPGAPLGPGTVVLASAVTSWTGAQPSPLASGPVPAPKKGLMRPRVRSKN